MKVDTIRILALSFVFILVSLSDATAQSAHAPDHSDEIAEMARSCSSAESGVSTFSDYLCLKGMITEQSGEDFARHISRTPKYVIVDSQGGSIRPAIHIARLLHDYALPLVISERCYSSCANYLIPAASELIALEGSLVVLHGHAPRNFSYFLALEMRQDQEALALAQSGSLENKKLTHWTNEAFEKYQSEITPLMQAEASLFSLFMNVDMHYLFRFREVKRNIALYGSPSCRQRKSMLLIVDEDFLKEFGISNITQYWWPNSELVLEKGLQQLGRDKTIVLGNDLFPSWIPGVGNTTRDICALVRNHAD